MMFLQNKKDLDNLMSNLSGNSEAMKARQAEEKAAQEDFMTEFKQVKKETIWPVIVDIGNQINQYGHDYHVAEEDEYVDATASYRPASITLNIYPAILDKTFYKPDSTPYISFVADKYAKKIGIDVSTMMPGEGGVVGSQGQYDLKKITPEFVESEIVKVLKNTLFLRGNK